MISNEEKKEFQELLAKLEALAWRAGFRDGTFVGFVVGMALASLIRALLFWSLS